MKRTIIRPIAPDTRIQIEFEGRPLDLYAIMLQISGDDGWRTVCLLDNAHGHHDLHRYNGREKQAAERFAEGPVNLVAPMAISYLLENWEAIVRMWKT